MSARSLILTVDCGNTRAHCGLVKPLPGLDVQPVAMFNLRVPFTSEDVGRAIIEHGIAPGHLASPSDLEAVVVASVNLKARAPIEQWTQEALGEERFVLLGRDKPIPIVNAIAAPEQVGKDRLVAALAAHRYRPGVPLIVLDFGTALTADGISPTGEYLGGIITPGVNLSMRALFENTALLPLVVPKKKPLPLGANTDEAIAAGVFYGYPGMVRGLIDALTLELTRRYQDKPLVIATGGDSAFLVDELPHGTIEQVIPTLTLDGIRLAYAS